MTNPNATLDALVAQKVGELTIQNAKLTVLNQALAQELQAAKARIAELEAREPELPIDDKKGAQANGKHAH